VSTTARRTSSPAGRARCALLPLDGNAGRLLLGVLLLAVACVLGLAVGSRALSPATALAALTGSGDVEATAILLGQRLPRTVLAAVGGASLAVAGVLVQGHTRNPLADPGLLGITAGASLAVVLAIAFLGAAQPAQHTWFALAGAAAATAVVVALARLAGSRRDSSPAVLVLAGSAVASVLSAATGVVLLLSTSAFDLFRFFAVGSLSGAHDLVALAPALVCTGAGMALALAHASSVDALVLGDDVATALGRDLATTRLVGLAAVTLLTGGAVVCVGSLGFVGLVVPHLARALLGTQHRWLVPGAALGGAVAVVLADVAGRVVVLPGELPVGVVLALLGSPLFVLIVLARPRVRRAPVAGPA